MRERRKTVRVRTRLTGQVSFNRRGALIDCAIDDLSLSGARLEIGSSIILPDEIDLVSAERPGALLSRIVWRSETACGVTFLPARPDFLADIGPADLDSAHLGARP